MYENFTNHVLDNIRRNQYFIVIYLYDILAKRTVHLGCFEFWDKYLSVHAGGDHDMTNYMTHRVRVSPCFLQIAPEPLLAINLFWSNSSSKHFFTVQIIYSLTQNNIPPLKQLLLHRQARYPRNSLCSVCRHEFLRLTFSPF